MRQLPGMAKSVGKPSRQYICAGGAQRPRHNIVGRRERAGGPTDRFGRLLLRSGIGGGITARVRLASALVRRGHAVTVVCNCR
jgi:hypothetical protein